MQDSLSNFDVRGNVLGVLLGRRGVFGRGRVGPEILPREDADAGAQSQ